MPDDFEVWMQKVDRIVRSKIGLSIDDLPDMCFSDYHADGLTPQEMARLALEEDGAGNLLGAE